MGSQLCLPSAASVNAEFGGTPLVASGFFQRHPVMRKAAKGAALGVVTGGLAAPLIGHSFASGAMLGAGRGAATPVVKDRWGKRHRSGHGPVSSMKSAGKRIASGVKHLFD